MVAHFWFQGHGERAWALIERVVLLLEGEEDVFHRSRNEPDEDEWLDDELAYGNLIGCESASLQGIESAWMLFERAIRMLETKEDPFHLRHRGDGREME